MYFCCYFVTQCEKIIILLANIQVNINVIKKFVAELCE
jgi:hypothetical protein